MKVIADLHIHSKYARATSPSSDLDGLSEWAKIKGVNVLATGDFTHPLWFKELKEKLNNINVDTGLYGYNGANFIISGEIALFYRVKGETKRIHIVLVCPSFEVAEQVNEYLAKKGNLEADGRPIFSFQPTELVETVKGISKEVFVMLAHIWTPWFSIFGSKSGVNSIEKAFEDQTKYVDALESGLSSDPKMNWMVSSIDKYPLVSNSDCHSPQKIGREANLLELGELSYKRLTSAIKTGKGFLKTYEFYPEEGKYHFDGHRNCDVVLSPEETRKYKGICPVCKKELTIGVLNRVYELADRKYGEEKKNSIPFKYIVPLDKLLAKILKKSEMSKGVKEEYMRIVKYFGSEFAVYEASEEKLLLATSKEIAEGISLVNKGKIHWRPGFDGEFGDFSFEKKERKLELSKDQKTLMDY